MILNLRDVGSTINLITGQTLLKEQQLYRSGTINEVLSDSELPPVQCILNVRVGADRIFAGKKQLHIPAVDQVENYYTDNGLVRRWANRALDTLAYPQHWPLLVHCTLGRDRTGVLVALILLALDIEPEVIIEEYALSESVHTTQHIEMALKGIGKIEDYLFNPNLITFFRQQLLVNPHS